MLLKAKTIALLGLMLAIAVVLVLLGSFIEMNTLFFLGIAGVTVGIAIREAGVRLGIGYYIAAVLLTFILGPNKLYCITFAGIGLYVVAVEIMRRTLLKKGSRILSGVVKFILYNIMYIPMLLLAPSFIYTGELNTWVLLLVWVAGQILLLVFDYAYELFITKYWTSIRKKLNLE